MKFSIPEHIVSSPYADELMMYDSSLNKYYLIKGAGKEILKLMEDGKSVAEICSILMESFGGQQMIEEEINEFISSMEEKQIIIRE